MTSENKRRFKATPTEGKPIESDCSSSTPPTDGESAAAKRRETPAREIGGRAGPDPVRYGDWEKQGRCIDF